MVKKGNGECEIEGKGTSATLVQSPRGDGKVQCLGNHQNSQGQSNINMSFVEERRLSRDCAYASMVKPKSKYCTTCDPGIMETL